MKLIVAATAAEAAVMVVVAVAAASQQPFSIVGTKCSPPGVAHWTYYGLSVG